MKAEKWIQDKLREARAEVSVHEFTYKEKQSESSETFRNIIGRIRPSEQRRVMKERASAARACKAVRRIWGAAERVGSTAFADGFSRHIYDDNSAFIDRGIPVALLIDFEYRWFHTTEDLPDKCSAESLGQVGRAVMEAIYGT